MVRHPTDQLWIRNPCPPLGWVLAGRFLSPVGGVPVVALVWYRSQARLSSVAQAGEGTCTALRKQDFECESYEESEGRRGCPLATGLGLDD